MNNPTKTTKAPMRVLCIDDDASILRLLELTLKPCNYELFTCQDPEEALKIIREEHIDTVISDHRMPRMDGLELLGLVCRLQPHVFRILLTAHASMELALQAINEGHVQRFLVKPWSTNEVRSALKHAEWELEQRRSREEREEQAPATSKAAKRGYGIVELDEKLFDSVEDDVGSLFAHEVA